MPSLPFGFAQGVHFEGVGESIQPSIQQDGTQAYLQSPNLAAVTHVESLHISEKTAHMSLDQPGPSRRTAPSPHKVVSTPDMDALKDEYDFERFTKDYFEYQEGEKDIIVRGRLKENLEFWESIGANNFILDAIKSGYKIPFYSLPPTVALNNNKSALTNSEFVSNAIEALLDRKLIEKCDNKPRVVNPLTVSTQSN